jgi:hypothetical protein
LQEYGLRFGKTIRLRLLSGQLLLVHLKVVERTTYSKVFFEQGWQNVIHAIGLERGDHIIISLIQNFKSMYLMEPEESRRKTRFGTKTTNNEMQI